MRDNTDFENELANSISQIIDEETSEARKFVKNNKSGSNSAQYADLNGETRRFDPITDEDLDDYREYDNEEEYEEEDIPDSGKKNGSKRFIIPIVLGVVAIGIIIAAVIIGRQLYANAISNSQDNYAYNNNMAYEAYANKQYQEAITYFEKALTYEEGKNNIDMMMYLRDCYVATKEDQKAEKLLNHVLEIDPYYSNALVLLITEYEDAKDYESIHALYDSVKSCNKDEVLALFKSFMCEVPSVSYESGEYNSDLELVLATKKDTTIYYTKNGNDPVKSGTLYDKALELTEGTYTIQFYAVNEYGFASEVGKEEYTIIYKAPSDATISPGSGAYQTASVQFITIGGIAKTAKAYYTLDGSTPTAYSTQYSGPFELPIGNTTVKVIVIDSNGLSSGITTATYSLSFVEKYTDEDCQELIWAALAIQGYCDGSTHLDASGVEYALGYYSKKEIQEKTMYLYNIYVGPEKQVYLLGCDANSGEVYAITQAGADYIMANLDPYTAPTVAPMETTEETAAAGN